MRELHGKDQYHFPDLRFVDAVQFPHGTADVHERDVRPGCDSIYFRSEALCGPQVFRRLKAILMRAPKAGRFLPGRNTVRSKFGLVGVPFCNSKAFRSLLLALCCSMINEASEYIILRSLLFSVVVFLLIHFPIHSTAKEIAKCGAPHGLVSTIVFRIRISSVSGNQTYQSCVGTSAR